MTSKQTRPGTSFLKCASLGEEMGGACTRSVRLLLQPAGCHGWQHDFGPQSSQQIPRMHAPLRPVNCARSPDGFYCAGTDRNTGPKTKACPPGSRATVFGQKKSSGCLQCATGFAQSVPGSTKCDVCYTSTGTGTGVCPSNCPDGQEGNVKVKGSCRPCAVSFYRSGDMPACIEVSTDEGPLPVSQLMGLIAGLLQCALLSVKLGVASVGSMQMCIVGDPLTSDAGGAILTTPAVPAWL
jgi:hypothetical protein